jgi:hypothetical protein
MRTLSTTVAALIIGCLLTEGGAAFFNFKCKKLSARGRRICEGNPRASIWCTCSHEDTVKSNLRLPDREASGGNGSVA